jgi:hypothetical protein
MYRHVLGLSLACCLFSCLPAPVTVNDEGLACATQDQASGALQIEVSLDNCGSACDEVLEASCSATLEGSVVRVASTLTIQPARPDTACIEICVARTASCTLEDLPAGDYTLEYNDQSAAFQIPLAASPACAGEEP